MRRLMICLLACVMCFSMPLRAGAAWVDKSVVHVRTDERVVALTFDDGPHPRYTARILEVLAKYDVKATFFMVGVNVERYPTAAREVAAAGHEIGNHTYRHARFATMTDDERRDEVEACARRILDTCGVSTTLFRTPEGVRGERLFRLLDTMGYRQILWNVDTLDWRGRDAREITATARCARGGDILLFHDYVAGKLASDTALDSLIPALQAEGYRFVTVSELLTYGEVVPPHF